MASTIYVGLAVCNNNNTWLGTYTFDNVAVSGCGEAHSLKAGSGLTTQRDRGGRNPN